MTKISATEKAAGKRADYHVYYRRGGKLYFDPMWAPTAEAAEAKFKAFALEAGWAVHVVRVRKVEADA